MLDYHSTHGAASGATFARHVAGTLTLLGLAASAHADRLPGTAQLSGRVTAAKPIDIATVYAFNTDRNVGYMVYVVDGRYRAVNLLPGRYDVTVRGAVGHDAGFTPQTTRLAIEVGEVAKVDFTVKSAAIEPDYVGGMTYPGAKIAPYGEIYPAGPGRDALERTCMGCHTVQLFPYNVLRTYPTGRTPKDKAGWEITVDRMHKEPAFGTPGKASYFAAELLPPKDRDTLIAYLANNFGVDSVPRVVQRQSEPKLDKSQLAKAMLVEYRFLNTPEMPARFTQQIDFDRNGNVWVTDRGAPALVRIDPRTGESTDYPGHGGGHGLAVDLDGTIWYSGDVVRRFDPTTDLHDAYAIEGNRRLGSNTQIFDSKGNLWLSLLTGGALGLWDRKTDTITYWDVPIERSRPYGIIVDHDDNVWFGAYHTSGVARFDPKTGTFRHYPLTKLAPTNIRRLGVDSKNYIWASTWGTPGMRHGALYRVDPATGDVVERKLDIEFANPYDTQVDGNDRVWVATDNYLVMLDQKSEKLTRYPLPARTDIPKMTITRDGAVWFTPRNAGQSGDYGGAASVLYPDKDAIKTFAAYFAANSAANRLSLYRGSAAPKVMGVVKTSPSGVQNAANPPVPTAPKVTGRTKREDPAEMRRLE